MVRAFLSLMCFLLPSIAAWSQQAASAASVPPKASPGVEAPWDAKTMLADLVKQTEELKPILEQMEPQQWTVRGASPTYAVQWNDAKGRVSDLAKAAVLLEKQPDQLPLAIETYFRFEALDPLVRSIYEGAQKYGNPGVADKIGDFLVKNSAGRGRFRTYIHDLATTREQEFRIADQEAQRCRGAISSQPASRTGRKK